MAKDRVMCPFSNRLCRDCALYRGRHLNLCYSQRYRGYLGVGKKPEKNNKFEIPAKIGARHFDPYEILLKEQREAMKYADRR